MNSRKVGMPLFLILLNPAWALPTGDALAGLQGHVLKQIRTATKLGPVSPDETIELSLVVKLDQDLMNQTLQQLYGADAPTPRHYLTPSEFAARFGLAEKRQKIKDFAKAHGLTTDSTKDNPLSMVLSISGNAQVVENTFGVQLYNYRGADGKIFRAHETEPMIPSSLSPHVTAVLGLSNIAGLWHPHLRIRSSSSPSDIACLACFPGTGPGHGVAPADIKSVYGFNSVGLKGSGQKVALVEFDGYNPSDVAAFANEFSLSNPTQTVVSVDGTTNVCSNQFQGSGCLEVTVDIDMIIALASNVAQILVYEGPNTDPGIIDTYNQIATDNIAPVVSVSWGLAEDLSLSSTISSEHAIFQRMAAQGQTIYAASGDTGADDDGSTLSVDDPASQPYVTGVGGTAWIGSVATSVEVIWDGSGGGVSAVWTIPSYQQGVVGLASNTSRNVPDVALNAAGYSAYAVYQQSNFGGWLTAYGTSFAAPLWAAWTVLVNEASQASGEPNIGFINPTLYPLGKGGSYHTLFNDITSGYNNIESDSNGYYSPGPGYDNVTGWGSYKAGPLIAKLTNLAPPTITLQPSNQTAQLGQSATFTVKANGIGDTYQWFEGISGVFSSIAGANAPTYTTPTPTVAYNKRQYECRVANPAGSVLSSAATLSVTAPQSVSTILVYPNPWDTRKHSGFPMRFSGLPDGITVKIFTITAHWVRTLYPSGGAASWDLTNSSGQAVASGYYLYLITDPQGNTFKGKIAIIR